MSLFRHRLFRHLACAAMALAALPAALGCGAEPAAPSPEGPLAEAQEALSTCVTLQRGTFGAVLDTTITANVTTPGWMSSAVTFRAGGTYEALLGFDVSAVPSNATVTSATLSLYTTDTVSGALLFARYALAPWSEPTSSYATFNQQAGKVVGSLTPSSPSTLQTMTVKPAAVQGWLDGSIPNHGMLFETMITGAPSAYKETVFVSSESPTVAQRPALTVCYTPFDYCATAPCQNGGTCSSGATGYTCACAPGYTGTNCQVATCGNGVLDPGEVETDCGGPCLPCPSSSAVVTGGDTSKSTHYQAIYTFGQPTQNQGTSTSSSYRLQGGLVGANGSLP